MQFHLWKNLLGNYALSSPFFFGILRPHLHSTFIIRPGKSKFVLQKNCGQPLREQIFHWKCQILKYPPSFPCQHCLFSLIFWWQLHWQQHLSQIPGFRKQAKYNTHFFPFQNLLLQWIHQEEVGTLSTKLTVYHILKITPRQVSTNSTSRTNWSFGIPR